MQHALKLFFLLLCCWHCSDIQAQRRGVYTNMALALQQPDKVLALDLRGQNLVKLPDSLYKLQNVQAILVGMKLRNLWLYPPAWKYKFHLKHLPAGGYLHLASYAGGEFYSFNWFKTAPLDFCRFPKLQVLDVDGGGIFSMTDSVACRMNRCRPEVLVMGGHVPGKKTDNDFLAWVDERTKARRYLQQFRIKR